MAQALLRSGMGVAERDLYSKGQLSFRPLNPSTEPGKRGLINLLPGSEKEQLLYVPGTYNATTPFKLVILLHGAGGNARDGIHYIAHFSESHSLFLLSPSSSSVTWDIISDDRFGHDLILIDKLLELVAANYLVDYSAMSIGGFSDGASYALSVGLSNGNIFSKIIAFSPGFFYTLQDIGKPRVFISHGSNDTVLPIQACSRRIVSRLKAHKYDVKYHEFTGTHEIPPHISEEAVRWLTAM